MLRYLGRYTHRVAISNHRLVSFDGEQVTFRWKDYARGNKQRLTLGIGVLAALRPKCASTRVRAHSPVWLPRQPAPNRKHCSDRQLLASEPQSQQSIVTAASKAQWQCPRCGNLMQTGHRLTPRELYCFCERLDTS